jgi:hypothetical protein
VIDYTKEDFTQGEERYDVIIDNVANHALLAVRGVLVPHGTYVLVGGGGRDDNRWLGPLVRPLRALVLSRLVSQRMGMMLAHMNPEDLTILAGMVQAGTLRPVIDRSYAFGQIPEALRYLETGHARGKVVIDYDAPSAAPASAGPTDGDVPSAGLVAFTLIGILAGITVAPVVAALALNRRFRRRNPGKRGYRWGYYFSVMSIVGGLLLGVILEAGAGVVLALGAVYGVLAFAFARRRRWAWLALTIVSFNPVAWIINLVYLWRRWAEDSMPPTRLGTTAAR